MHQTTLSEANSALLMAGSKLPAPKPKDKKKVNKKEPFGATTGGRTPPPPKDKLLPRDKKGGG